MAVALAASGRHLNSATAVEVLRGEGLRLEHLGGGAFEHYFSAQSAGARPDVERVGYALVGGEWRRATQPMLDGTALSDGDRLVGEVSAAAVRYRDEKGNWSESWTSDPGDRLPRAVEVRLTRTGRAPLTMLFLTAPAVPPPLVAQAPAP